MRSSGSSVYCESVMDKPSGSKKRSVKNKRMMRSKVSVELHLLPTDVLRDILSRLSLKEAVRMSGLSREWRRLGICHPDLVFTRNTFGSNKSRDTKLESMDTEFIAGVDNVLRPLWSTSTTTTTTVNKFVVKFGLGRHQTHHIDRWIDFSVVSMAKHIGLELPVGDGPEDDKYIVPMCKLSGPNGSCVESLDMAYVRLKLPPSFLGIINLKKLSLHRVSIDGSDLQSLLLSCGLLESLSLDCCPLSSLSVRQELCKLRYLSVRDCALGMIQLQAPNLTTFEFDDSPTQIMLGESSRLSEATFVLKNNFYSWCCDATDYILTEPPTALPHVHKLFLHMVVEYKQKLGKAQSPFLNLRHLNLNIDIIDNNEDISWHAELIKLLELAPLLEELELHIDSGRSAIPDRTVAAASGPLHRHLRIVLITGFSDFEGIAELTLYILENASVLERMVVDPVVWTGQLYSVSKPGSSKEFVRPSVPEGQLPESEFAKKHLDREEFRHILTIF